MGIREKIRENFHHWSRFQSIVRVLARHGFASLVQELGWLSAVTSKSEEAANEETTPVRLRKAFEELGTTFIKLGQLLSTRPDILPAEFIREFEKLTDRITPLPFTDIQKVIESEFGRPYQEIFEHIETSPLAAASIAQVHRARLKDESFLQRDVVIKVQRPEIVESIQSDIQILYLAAQALETLRDDLKLFNLKGIVEEFQRSIFEELDFVLEAKNIDAFQTIVSKHPQLLIPQVYWPYTTKRILTMSELPGVTLSQIHDFPPHLNRKKLAESTVSFFVEGIFFHGIFHCDAHAGNLLVDTTGEGRVGIVDFGMVGRLNDALKEKLTRLFLALVTQDFQSLAMTYSELAEFGRRLSVKEFQRDLEHLLAPNLSRSLSEVDVGEMMQESLTIAQKHKIRLPRDLISFFRALVTLEHVGRSLDPDFRFSDFGQRFSKEIWKRQLSSQNLSREFLKAVEGLRLLPGALRTLAHKLDSNDFFSPNESLDRGLRAFKRSNQLLTAAVIFSANLIGTVILEAFSPNHPLLWPLWIFSGISLLICVVQAIRR